jgi:hypothetical protein
LGDGETNCLDRSAAGRRDEDLDVVRLAAECDRLAKIAAGA